MFEQATLSNARTGTRAWSAFLGLTAQAAAVSFAVLVPMVWPQVLPTTRILETLVPPLPPAPHQLGETKSTTAARPAAHVRWAAVPFQQPSSIPPRVFQIVDEPETGVAGSVSGPVTGSFSGVIQGILDGVGRSALPVPPPKPAIAVVTKPPEPALVIKRYTEGGNVFLGAPLRRVEPPYPQLARAARVSGVVELECVVGADGRIKEVKAVSGNPLLVRAAIDAAWQWIYAPSKLNGVPIEIITNLKFTFKLN
ncbi:MAG TPA: energy transducer TonB [Bryobacteraceae bacterium]|nr:energy transducer TonB [Bryobacteraceae bacterium]